MTTDNLIQAYASGGVFVSITPTMPIRTEGGEWVTQLYLAPDNNAGKTVVLQLGTHRTYPQALQAAIDMIEGRNAKPAPCVLHGFEDMKDANTPPQVVARKFTKKTNQ